MKISALFFSAVASLILMSCMSSMNVQEAKGEEQHWIIPGLNETSEAFLGDSLLKEGTATMAEVITLKEDHGTPSFTYFHYKGAYKYVGTSVIKDNEDKKNVKVYQGSTLMPGNYGIFNTGVLYPQIYETDDGSVYLYGMMSDTKLDENEYTKSIAVDSVDTYFFEQQLIYTGSEEHILKFTYREFADGTVRPAFSIDATYDMSKESRIRFKGAVLDILSYDNQSIRYRVISGFKS